MSIDLQWNLLTNASQNFGNNLMQAAGQIRQRRDQSRDRSALTNYLNNPNDAAAFTGLAERNPAQAFQIRNTQRTEARQERSDSREDLLLASRLLGSVTDATTWQQAREEAGRLNIPLDGIPEIYDPNWVQQARRRVQMLSPRDQPQGPNIQREVEYYRSIGRPEMADQLLARHAEGPPIVFDADGDGAPDLVPRSYFNSGGGQGASPAQGQTLRNPQTGGMIRLDPATNQWVPVVQGGPQARPAGNF